MTSPGFRTALIRITQLAELSPEFLIQELWAPGISLGSLLNIPTLRPHARPSRARPTLYTIPQDLPLISAKTA